MRDVIAIAIVLGFFAICAGYIAWCDRIIGDDTAAGVKPAGGSAAVADPTASIEVGTTGARP